MNFQLYFRAPANEQRDPGLLIADKTFADFHRCE